jgi:hypothetical protein
MLRFPAKEPLFMSKNTLFTLLAITAVTATAIAYADPITDIRASDSTLNPYQVLQKLYNESSVPAALTDFDFMSNTSSNQHCSAAAVDGSPAYRLQIAQVQTVLVPGTPATPAQGPLFPGTPAIPDQMGTVLTYGVTDQKSDLAAPGATAKIVITTTATDLVQTTTDANDDESPMVMSVRKNGAFLSLHAVLNSGLTTQTDVYAYCYRQ